MAEAIYDTEKMNDALENQRCTVGLHPSLSRGCACGSAAKDQCCDEAFCRVHKCGLPVRCQCRLPEGTA
jgi:hypothetical protein